jgi:pimeloyl-ACP methyl ester carboxylesterase
VTDQAVLSGPGGDEAIHPFPIHVADEDIEDLRRRLRATRWPAPFDGGGHDYGIDTAVVRSLCEEWEGSFDWRATEARLNALGSFRTEIGGAGVHFLHARSPEAGALPLVLTHGWPGSVLDFADVVAPLADPVAHGADGADAFHVICPSIPGFGFSGPTSRSGWDPRRIADAVATLLDRLGYRRFVAQGGDWGSTISTWLGARYPDRVLGVHLNTVSLSADAGRTTPDLTPAEKRALDRLRRYLDEGSGYAQIQRTRPNTAGLALDDSPAGLCAWIIEKYQEWTDCGGDPRTRFPTDHLLATVSLYWFTRTAASSARIYRETLLAGTGTYDCPRVEVPTGCALYPAEIAAPSRRWAEPRYRIVHWNELPEGGHFAAAEVPDLFVDDVRAFARLLR